MPKINFSYAPAFYGNPASAAAALPVQKAAMTAIHNGLLAIGLVQLSDTGQLNIDTMPAVSTSTSTENVAGFRLYEMVDDLTPTLRVIIKVEFCRPPIGHTLPQYCEVMLNIYVGHATDGAGAFVGNSINASRQVAATTSSRLTPIPASIQSYMCVKDHSIMLAVGVGLFAINTVPATPVIAGFAVIARTRDANGVADGRGVVAFGPANDAAITSWSHRMTMSISVPSAGINMVNIKDSPVIMGAYLPTASVGGAPQIQFPLAAVPKIYPFTPMGMYPSGGALSVGDIVELNVDGDIRQYVAIGMTTIWPSTSGPIVSVNGRSAGNIFYDSGVCLLYET